MNKKIFLTGLPDCGKSTVLMNVINILRGKRLRVGGVITPEVRVGKIRKGFKVVDIHSGEEGTLASVDFKSGPRVGKYYVDVRDFERVALRAIDFAVSECDIVCIDEIGKMELFSEKFREKVDEILKSGKPLIAVVHRNLVSRYERYGYVVHVTPNNREKLPREISGLMGK